MAWTKPGYPKPPGWAAIRRRILARDRKVCYVCGQDGADQVDHVTPVSRGGTHDPTNLAAIHSVPCHQLKTEQERLTGLRRRPNPTASRLPPERHPGSIETDTA